MTTFAASVGGLATPVGAAPNMIGLGFIRDVLQVNFSFLAWCAVGVPAAVVLFLFVAAYLGLFCPRGHERNCGRAGDVSGGAGEAGTVDVGSAIDGDGVLRDGRVVAGAGGVGRGGGR